MKRIIINNSSNVTDSENTFIEVLDLLSSFNFLGLKKENDDDKNIINNNQKNFNNNEKIIFGSIMKIYFTFNRKNCLYCSDKIILKLIDVMFKIPLEYWKFFIILFPVHKILSRTKINELFIGYLEAGNIVSGFFIIDYFENLLTIQSYLKLIDLLIQKDEIEKCLELIRKYPIILVEFKEIDIYQRLFDILIQKNEIEKCFELMRKYPNIFLKLKVKICEYIQNLCTENNQINGRIKALFKLYPDIELNLNFKGFNNSNKKRRDKIIYVAKQVPKIIDNPSHTTISPVCTDNNEIKKETNEKLEIDIKDDKKDDKKNPKVKTTNQQSNVHNNRKKLNYSHFGPVTPGCFQMPIKFEEIIFIDTLKKLENATQIFEEKIIGFDSEWKPFFFNHQENKTAILQITGENCFIIIDLIKLGNKKELEIFLTKLFQDKNSIKLGVQFDEDLKRAQMNYLNNKAFSSFYNYIDIQKAFNFIENEKGSQKTSLAKITKKILNIGLCKKLTKSNWEKRPLPKSLLHYAISDAYIEVLIYKAMISKYNLDPSLVKVDIIPK